MRRKETAKRILEKINITDMASTGRAVAKENGQVIFIEGAMPGDQADIMIYKNKKSFLEARVVKFHKRSEKKNPQKIQLGKS